MKCIDMDRLDHFWGSDRCNFHPNCLLFKTYWRWWTERNTGQNCCLVFIQYTRLSRWVHFIFCKSNRTCSWLIFYNFLNFKGNDFPSRQLSQRILAATWCLIAFVFVNIYNSTLTSYMSVTYQRPTINSFDDLATNPSYKATILTGSIQEIDILVNIFYFYLFFYNFLFLHFYLFDLFQLRLYIRIYIFNTFFKPAAIT